MELPHLMSSMVIAGLPPPARASYDTEAEKFFMETAKRWQIDSLKLWNPISILWCGSAWSGTVSPERFIAVSYLILLVTILDDLLIDAAAADDSLLEEFGIDRAVCDSPSNTGAFYRHLCVLFQREAPLENPTPIEGMMWESGQEFRRLSMNPEWFTALSDSLAEHFEANVASKLSDGLGKQNSFQDVETYTQMRVYNSGFIWSMLLLELTLHVFLDKKMRAHPTYQQLLNEAIIQMMFVNDIFSYTKEALEEPDNPRNLIRVMTDFEGMGFPQAAWRTVEIINAHARTVLELEKQLLILEDEEPWAHGVRANVEGVKVMMSGNLEWHSASKRYRRPESVFPELRGTCGTVDERYALPSIPQSTPRPTFHGPRSD